MNILRNRFPIFLWLSLTLVLSACHKEKESTPQQIVAKITAFTFESKYNTGLDKDYPLIISGNSINGTIKPSFPKSLIASFTTNAVEVLVNNVKQESTKTLVDFSEPVMYTVVSTDGSKQEYTVRINWNFDLPHIYIQTENNVPVESKTDYVQATISIEGNGAFNNYSASTKIRGRGNSTWGMPKKPYRLKLDSKAALFGLPASKNWVLLANYIDDTQMLNAVAMKTGQLLNMPYTNHIIPVDVTINNRYLGNYMFTEQVEVASNRIAVENGGVLLELDQYFDEPWEFKSNNYELPVMIKYPELVTAAEMQPIQTAFHQMEDAIAASSFPNNNYSDYIDTGSVANYFIVALLTDNEELNHPKSTYLYKPLNDKFSMGPIWDFDWAFGYEGTQVYFSNYNMPLFWTSHPEPGTAFFSRFFKDPAFVALCKAKWASFKTAQLPVLLQYVQAYANQIEQSRNADYLIWKTGSGNFRTDVNKLYSWLQNRAAFIDGYLASL
jgi:CotH kinase protein